MWAKDQAALAQYEESLKSLPKNASDQAHRGLFKVVEAQWEINRFKLDSIISIHGWPGNRLVGTYGAKLAWAVPQHYPDVFYKEKCLALMQAAMERGDLDPNHFAELTDRIARETWQKQTYGASMAKDAPYPIQNPAQVDQRRFALGLLDPVEIYAFYHGIQYQIPEATEAKMQAQVAHETAQENYTIFTAFAKQGKADSANVYLKKAIDFHGDISNAQLYQAALQLAQMDNQQSKRISTNILKVLIWRKWKGRAAIPTESALESLQDQEAWSLIRDLLKQSQ